MWQEDRERPREVRKDMQESLEKIRKTNGWEQVMMIPDGIEKRVRKFNLNMCVPNHGEGV